MLDLNSMLETTEKTLAELKKTESWSSSFEGIQTISRYMHFIELLAHLKENAESKENYLAAFKYYFDQTHDSTSFITAHPESNLSLNFYKIAIHAGNTFNLSPFNFIFPGIPVSDDDFIDDLSNHKEFQEHIQEKNISDEQLPHYLSSIVKRYICGERTLIDKKMLCENYIFDDNRSQRGTFKELPQGNEEFFSISLSDSYTARINMAINNKEVEKYIRMTLPHYDPTFIGQLNYLADQLFENGVQGKFGSEGVAGRGAERAIAWFTQEILPKYQEIYQELGKSKNEKKFLKFLMTKDNKGLADINCVDIKSQMIKTFIAQNESFLFSLDEIDPENTPVEEIQTLKLKLRAENVSTLFIDKGLTLDLYAFNHSNSLQFELSTLLTNADYIPYEALKKYLKSSRVIGYTIKPTKEEFFDAVQLNPFHLNLALDHLILHKDYSDILDRLKNENALHFIKNQLMDSHLNESRKKIFLLLGIKMGSIFIQLAFQSLREEKYFEFYNAIKESLPSVIQTSEDLMRVLKGLHEEQCKEVCNIMKESMPLVIKTSGDFERLLNGLSQKQCDVVYNAMKDILPSLIETYDDFKLILKGLSMEQCREVCYTMKEILFSFINTSNDLANVLYRLSDNSFEAVYNAVKTLFPSLFKTSDELGKVLFKLSTEKCEKFCREMKETLHHLIQTSDDIEKLLFRLSKKQCDAIYDLLKVIFPSIIKTSDDLGKVLFWFSKERYEFICYDIIEIFSSIIQTNDDLNNLFSWLSEEQCDVINDILKKNLPFLKADKTYFNLFTFFTSESGEQVKENVKETKFTNKQLFLQNQ